MKLSTKIAFLVLAVVLLWASPNLKAWESCWFDSNCACDFDYMSYDWVAFCQYAPENFDCQRYWQACFDYCIPDGGVATFDCTTTGGGELRCRCYHIWR